MSGPKAWNPERASWRTAIQPKLVRSVNTTSSSAEMGRTAAHTTSSFNCPITSPVGSHINDGGPTKKPSAPSPVQRSNTYALLTLRLAQQQRERRAGCSGSDGSKLDDVTVIIASCVEGMEDEVVRDAFRRRKVRMELAPGYAEGRNAERTTSNATTWAKSDASDCTTKTTEGSRERMIYDTGGSRTPRAAWYPFFDDINAISSKHKIGARNRPLRALKTAG
ncbi:hypothetical protein C8Q80DRAFT_1265678 [Daedaleopsis nitida]|nr:hypothetical protein C8Q80DRAFT_1265678 [Daedaleopsis nitida]